MILINNPELKYILTDYSKIYTGPAFSKMKDMIYVC